MSSATEADLQIQVADYLRLQYPDVLFHSDFGSGVKLTLGQAVRQKRQNGGRRAWPDMFISDYATDYNSEPDGAELRSLFKRYRNYSITFTDDIGTNYILCGLYLELKKDGTRLKKKNGEWATNHLAEQAELLEELRLCGYCAEFAVGFDEAKRIIDEYLGGQDESAKN